MIFKWPRTWVAIVLTLLALPWPDGPATYEMMMPISPVAFATWPRKYLLIAYGDPISVAAIRYCGGRVIINGQPYWSKHYDDAWLDIRPSRLDVAIGTADLGHLQWQWQTAGFGFINTTSMSGFRAELPLWPLSALACSLVWYKRRKWEKKWSTRFTTCMKCGYDLRATPPPMPCPECGSVIAVESSGATGSGTT